MASHRLLDGTNEVDLHNFQLLEGVIDAPYLICLESLKPLCDDGILTLAQLKGYVAMAEKSAK